MLDRGIIGYLVGTAVVSSQLALIGSVAAAVLAGILSYFYYLRTPGGLSVSEYLSLMVKFFKGQRRFFYRKPC